MRTCFTKVKFNRVVPMTVQADACKSMVEFTHNVGIPENLVTNGTGEFTRKDATFVKRSEMNASENATIERSRKESESCSRLRCRVPHYVLTVKDDKEEGTEVHSRFQADLSQVIIAHGAWRRS